MLIAAGLWAMDYFAPLQACSVVFDLSLLVVAAGAISLVIPLRFLEIRSRRTGAAVLFAGVVVGIAALNWPVSRHATANQFLLDRFMPAYTVREFHSARVHAAPERVYQAIKQTTFADLKVFAVLMQIRMAAAGRFRKVQAPAVPIVDIMSRPGSGFLPLADNGRREIVLGLAGRFWSNGPPARVRNAPEFEAYRNAGAARSAFDLRIKDLGSGWCELSTETRAIGTDAAGDRAMARYWRVIYPGSAAIRRMWLDAIKRRAEATAGSAI